jgi:hypothetical protein
MKNFLMYIFLLLQYNLLKPIKKKRKKITEFEIFSGNKIFSFKKKSFIGFLYDCKFITISIRSDSNFQVQNNNDITELIILSNQKPFQNNSITFQIPNKSILRSKEIRIAFDRNNFNFNFYRYDKNFYTYSKIFPREIKTIYARPEYLNDPNGSFIFEESNMENSKNNNFFMDSFFPLLKENFILYKRYYKKRNKNKQQSIINSYKKLSDLYNQLYCHEKAEDL